MIRTSTCFRRIHFKFHHKVENFDRNISHLPYRSLILIDISFLHIRFRLPEYSVHVQYIQISMVDLKIEPEVSTMKLQNIIILLFTISPSSSSSSSCRVASTDILDPLSPLFPIVHRLWQVYRTTSRILTWLLNVCSCWSSCFCPAICGGP